MKTSHIKLILLLTLLCGLVYLQPVHAETVTQTRHFYEGYYYTVGLFDGCLPFLTEPSTFGMEGYMERIQASSNPNIKGQWAIRIYEIFWNSDSIEITSEPIGIVQRDTNGEGYQSNTYNFTAYNMTMGSGLMIEVYHRSAITTWGAWQKQTSYLTAQQQFVTEGLMNIANSIWNITYYTYRNQTGTSYKWRFYFGSEIYNSRIENMQFDSGVSDSTGLTFSSGFIVAGVIAALVCVVAVAVGLSGKKRR